MKKLNKGGSFYTTPSFLLLEYMDLSKVKKFLKKYKKSVDIII